MFEKSSDIFSAAVLADSNKICVRVVAKDDAFFSWESEAKNSRLMRGPTFTGHEFFCVFHIHSLLILVYTTWGFFLEGKESFLSISAAELPCRACRARHIAGSISDYVRTRKSCLSCTTAYQHSHTHTHTQPGSNGTRCRATMTRRKYSTTHDIRCNLTQFQQIQFDTYFLRCQWRQHTKTSDEPSCETLRLDVYIWQSFSIEQPKRNSNTPRNSRARTGIGSGNGRVAWNTHRLNMNSLLTKFSLIIIFFSCMLIIELH